LMIHQLEIGGHGYGGSPRITGGPEWHSPSVFTAWIEENISPTPEHRYPNAARPAPDSVDNNKKQAIYQLRFRRSGAGSGHSGEPAAESGLAFGRPVRRLGAADNSMARPWARQSHWSVTFFLIKTMYFPSPSRASYRSPPEEFLLA